MGGKHALNLSPKFVFMWLLICEWYVKKRGAREDQDRGWVDVSRKPTLKC